jgi:hypothetical protein
VPAGDAAADRVINSILGTAPRIVLSKLEQVTVWTDSGEPPLIAATPT